MCSPRAGDVSPQRYAEENWQTCRAWSLSVSAARPTGLLLRTKPLARLSAAQWAFPAKPPTRPWRPPRFPTSPCRLTYEGWQETMLRSANERAELDQELGSMEPFFGTASYVTTRSATRHRRFGPAGPLIASLSNALASALLASARAASRRPPLPPTR